MPKPPTDMTGEIRFRNGWNGCLVLQVELENYTDALMGPVPRRWRDARQTDLRVLRALRRDKESII